MWLNRKMAFSRKSFKKNFTAEIARPAEKKLSVLVRSAVKKVRATILNKLSTILVNAILIVITGQSFALQSQVAGEGGHET